MLLLGLMHSMVEALVLFYEIESLALGVKHDSETAGSLLLTSLTAILKTLVFSAPFLVSKN